MGKHCWWGLKGMVDWSGIGEELGGSAKEVKGGGIYICFLDGVLHLVKMAEGWCWNRKTLVF